MKSQRVDRAWSRGATLVACAVVAGVAFAAGHSYRDIPPDFLPTIEAAEQAFNDRNAAAVAPFLAEEYSWWQVTPAGPKEMVRGRTPTVELLQKFYQSGAWVESQFERLGMVGNILVQVEEDTIRVEGKPVKKVTLNLYEFRDGRRWREWKFYPQGEGPGGVMPVSTPAGTPP